LRRVAWTSLARLIKGTRGITKGARQRRGVLVAINFQCSHITEQNVCRNKNRTLTLEQRERNYKVSCACYFCIDCSLKERKIFKIICQRSSDSFARGHQFYSDLSWKNKLYSAVRVWLIIWSRYEQKWFRTMFPYCSYKTIIN